MSCSLIAAVVDQDVGHRSALLVAGLAAPSGCGHPRPQSRAPPAARAAPRSVRARPSPRRSRRRPRSRRAAACHRRPLRPRPACASASIVLGPLGDPGVHDPIEDRPATRDRGRRSRPARPGRAHRPGAARRARTAPRSQPAQAPPGAPDHGRSGRRRRPPPLGRPASARRWTFPHRYRRSTPRCIMAEHASNVGHSGARTASEHRGPPPSRAAAGPSRCHTCGSGPCAPRGRWRHGHG